MAFKDILKLLIEQKGCTQREFAEYVGVRPNTVSDWLGKKGTSPKVEYLYKMTKFFNVSFDYLFTGKESFSKLSTDEEEMLSLYRQLSHDDKLKQIGRLENIVETYAEEKAQSQDKEKNVG
ncbi:MAG: helix-turn-helix domain-containing protein [Oscillospiraceae bacterium]